MRTIDIVPPYSLSASVSGVSLTDSGTDPLPLPEPEPESTPCGSTLRHRVIDFHFGCALGFGFYSGNDGGEIPFTLSAPASKGATSFAFTGTAPKVQLLVLLGTDGQYYTAVGLSIVGSVCNLCDPLPCDIAAGQNVWSFWDNNAHPNSKGYAAIADHALRQDFAVWRKVWSGSPAVKSPATVAAYATNSVINPGSASSGNGWAVTPGGAGGGATWSVILPSVGDYKLSFECTKSVEGSADVNLSILSNGVEVKSYAVKTLTAGRHEVDFHASGQIEIRLTRSSVAFYPSNITIYVKEEAGIASLNSGRHMVIGDSWVADLAGIASRISARLPTATVVKSGVGGNKASDLLARFDTDVAPQAPFDYVWIMVGTNDIAAGITPAVFSNNLFALINKVQALGAVPIVFTPYPGCTDIPTRIDTARCYMAYVPYWW